MQVKLVKCYGITEEEAMKLDRREIPSRLLSEGINKGENASYSIPVKAYAEIRVTKDDGQYYCSKLYVRSAMGNWYRISSYGFIKEFKKIAKENDREDGFYVKVRINCSEEGKTTYGVERVG